MFWTIFLEAVGVLAVVLAISFVIQTFIIKDS